MCLSSPGTSRLWRSHRYRNYTIFSYSSFYRNSSVRKKVCLACLRCLPFSAVKGTVVDPSNDSFSWAHRSSSSAMANFPCAQPVLGDKRHAPTPNLTLGKVSSRRLRRTLSEKVKSLESIIEILSLGSDDDALICRPHCLSRSWKVCKDLQSRMSKALSPRNLV